MGLDKDGIFLEDGISGAKFGKRPDLVRCCVPWNRSLPAFQVLVMMDEARLGCETIEVAFMLKQIVQADVRVFFYLDDREHTLETPMDKMMLSLTAFGDELKRAEVSQL
jgi:DNA invertase Pin-like site-specific DNA recombinase